MPWNIATYVLNPSLGWPLSSGGRWVAGADAQFRGWPAYTLTSTHQPSAPTSALPVTQALECPNGVTEYKDTEGNWGVALILS